MYKVAKKTNEGFKIMKVKKEIELIKTKINWIQIHALVVNDRKFPARTVFFSHSKPASSNNPRSYTIVLAPAEQADKCFKKIPYIETKNKKTNEFIYNKKFGYKHKKCWFQINIEILG